MTVTRHLVNSIRICSINKTITHMPENKAQSVDLPVSRCRQKGSLSQEYKSRIKVT